MGIQDSINQVIGTAAGAVVAAQHLEAQKEQNAISSQGHLSSAIEHQNLKEMQYDQASQELNKAETEMPGEQLAADLEQSKSDIRLKQMDADDLNANMMSKHPRNEKGQFESKDSATNRWQKVNDELEYMKKAQQELQNKIDARKAQEDLVKMRFDELRRAHRDVDLAEYVANKYASQLGGKK